MKLRLSWWKLGIVIAIVAATSVGAAALALGSALTPGPIACSPKFECLDVWDPVICDNGQVYSNFCYARRACATGCVPLGAQVE